MIKWYKCGEGRYTDNAELHKSGIGIVRGDLTKKFKPQCHVSKWSLYVFDPKSFWVWIGEHKTLRAAKAAAELIL